MNRVGELAYIIVDCEDNERVAEFWSNVLGQVITQRSDPYIDLEPSREGAPILSFQKVPEPKQAKNRLHMDIKVPDLEVATEQIIQLGGKLVRICAQEPYDWRIMADPEDNEFCLVEN